MTELLGAHPDLIRRGIFRGVDLTVLRDRFWRLESMRAVDLRSPPQIRWRAWKSNWVGGMAGTLRNRNHDAHRPGREHRGCRRGAAPRDGPLFVPLEGASRRVFAGG